MDCRSIERLADINIKFTEVITCDRISKTSSIEEKSRKLTRWAVVANGKVWWSVRPDIGKTFGAVLSGATDLRGALPNDLRKVTPVAKVGHVRISLPVEILEVPDLAVVEEFGDDSCYVVRSKSSSDVLTVATTVGCGVVSIHTCRGDLCRSGCESIVPHEVAGGMIGTVDVVRDQDTLLIRGGLRRGGRCT